MPLVNMYLIVVLRLTGFVGGVHERAGTKMLNFSIERRVSVYVKIGLCFSSFHS